MLFDVIGSHALWNNPLELHYTERFNGQSPVCIGLHTKEQSCQIWYSFMGWIYLTGQLQTPVWSAWICKAAENSHATHALPQGLCSLLSAHYPRCNSFPLYILDGLLFVLCMLRIPPNPCVPSWEKKSCFAQISASPPYPQKVPPITPAPFPVLFLPPRETTGFSRKRQFGRVWFPAVRPRSYQ